MPLRIETHSRLTISNDNSFSPTDLVFSSGDKSVIDFTTFNLGDSKVLNLAPSAANQAVAVDGLTEFNVIMLLTAAQNVSVTLVPVGGTLSACSPIPLLPNYPLSIGANIAGIYLSNGDAMNAAQVHLGYAGN